MEVVSESGNMEKISNSVTETKSDGFVISAVESGFSINEAEILADNKVADEDTEQAESNEDDLMDMVITNVETIADLKEQRNDDEKVTTEGNATEGNVEELKSENEVLLEEVHGGFDDSINESMEEEEVEEEATMHEEIEDDVESNETISDTDEDEDDENYENKPTLKNEVQKGKIEKPTEDTIEIHDDDDDDDDDDDEEEVVDEEEIEEEEIDDEIESNAINKIQQSKTTEKKELPVQDDDYYDESENEISSDDDNEVDGGDNDDDDDDDDDESVEAVHDEEDESIADSDSDNDDNEELLIQQQQLKLSQQLLQKQQHTQHGHQEKKKSRPKPKSAKLKKKPKVQWTFRAILKKRSIKCLNRRMHISDDGECSSKEANYSNQINQEQLPASSVTLFTAKTKETAEPQTGTSIQLPPKDHQKIQITVETVEDDIDMAIVQIEDSPVKLNGNSGHVKNDEKKMEKEIPPIKIAIESSPELIKMDVSEEVEAEIIETKEQKSEKLPKQTEQSNGNVAVVEVAENAEVPEDCRKVIESKKEEEDEKSESVELKSVPVVPKSECKEVPKINAETTEKESIVAAVAAAVTPTINQKEQDRQDPRPNRKRPVSDQTTTADEDEEVPAKKRLCIELEKSFESHDKILREYIDKTSNTGLSDIQRHIDQLQIDIQALTELALTKEMEWNNILHLKKVKEEIAMRLNRKKNVMEIMSTKVGEVNDYSILDQSQQPSLSKKITKELQHSILANNNNNNNNMSANNLSMNSVTMVPLLSSTPTGSANSTLQSIIQNRANMKEADLAKEKPNTARLHSILFSRNILPKPAHSNPPQIHSSNYNTNNNNNNTNSTSSIAQTQLDHRQQQQFHNHHEKLMEAHQQNISSSSSASVSSSAAAAAAAIELMRENQLAIGRQGAIKNVKSIIDDYRQKHPEPMPRRGRRFKGPYNGDGGSSNRNVDSNRQSVENRMSELGLLLTKIDGNSRPSSTESNQMANDRLTMAMTNATNLLAGHAAINNTSTPLLKGQTAGFPEVTLHPVQAQIDKTNQHSSNSQAGSLLHGILTKNTRPSSGFTSYSPTLARLLTAPERIAPLAQNNYQNLQNSQQQQQQQLSSGAGGGGGINLSKVKSEITITPVIQPHHQNQHQSHQQQQQQHTILQQQLQKIHDSRVKQEYFNMDDEADDSADRLVIDEGDTVTEQLMQNQQSSAVLNEFRENEVPECQGCKKREAQFVCAGCGHQWYCSRECQVSAWDEHSDVCTG